MNKLNNKSGFTLIEIIVVLIIVGILAAIALPNLFSNISKSRAGEAIASLSPLKAATEGCLQANVGTENNCTAAHVGMAATTNFTYAFGTAPAAGSGGGNYTIVATSTATPGNTITLTKSTATGTFTCAGASQFAGVC